MLQEQKSERRQRSFALTIVLLALLIFVILYGLPILSSTGNEQSSSGLSETQQRQIAFDLAQNIQNYRDKINEKRRINYGDAYLSATGTSTIFRPSIPFDGMNSPIGAKNDTHSEAKLKGWALTTIRKNLQKLASGSTINVLIFTQVKVCAECRTSIQQWANQLQQVAQAGVNVNLYIWQQTNFDIENPDQTPVRTQNDVESAISASAS